MALLTLAFLFILHIVKRVFAFIEKDHWASDTARQISLDEYEEQTEELTEKEVDNLKRSAGYK